MFSPRLMPGTTAGTAVAVMVMGPSWLAAAASRASPPPLAPPRPPLPPRPRATGGGPSRPRPRPAPARTTDGGAIAAAAREADRGVSKQGAAGEAAAAKVAVLRRNSMAGCTRGCASWTAICIAGVTSLTGALGREVGGGEQAAAHPALLLGRGIPIPLLLVSSRRQGIVEAHACGLSPLGLPAAVRRWEQWASGRQRQQEHFGAARLQRAGHADERAR